MPIESGTLLGVILEGRFRRVVSKVSLTLVLRLTSSPLTR